MLQKVLINIDADCCKMQFKICRTISTKVVQVTFIELKEYFMVIDNKQYGRSANYNNFRLKIYHSCFYSYFENEAIAIQNN